MKRTTKKISEWLKEPHLGKGSFTLIERNIDKETEKAVCVKLPKMNRSANLYMADCWFPKSQIMTAENDFYKTWEGGFFIPWWLYENKRNAGYDI